LIGAGAQLGNEVYIGPGAVIRGGCKIGDRAYIAPGAIVMQDVPADKQVFGNPAKQID
jgi:acetyltransferase-like isoleucine patch superfamily enzyme